MAADLLPEALQKPPTAISISGGTGVCQYDPTGESIGAVDPAPFVVCDIPQLGPGEDRVITIQGTLAPDSAGTQVDNLALSSNTLPFAGVFSFEPDFSNNDDLVSFTPGTVDTGIEKSLLSPGPLSVGDEAVFGLLVYNDGDVPATDLVVRDTLPAGLTPVDPPEDCEIEGRDVVCRVDSLAPDEELEIEIGALVETAAAGRTLTNGATVTLLGRRRRRRSERQRGQRERQREPSAPAATRAERRRGGDRRVRPAVRTPWAFPAPGACGWSTTAPRRPPTSS